MASNDKLEDFVRHISAATFLAQPKMPEIPPMRSLVVENIEANYASEFHQQLQKWISDFDASLDNEHQVGVRIVSFGPNVTIRLKSFGFSNPSLVIFSGWLETGEPVELIQHVTQISVLVIKMRRIDPSEPKKPIGFHVCRDEGRKDTEHA